MNTKITARFGRKTPRTKRSCVALLSYRREVKFSANSLATENTINPVTNDKAEHNVNIEVVLSAQMPQSSSGAQTELNITWKVKGGFSHRGAAVAFQNYCQCSTALRHQCLRSSGLLKLN